MTKKFLSLVLSLALVIGLLPTMGVHATSTVVTHFVDDFESWSDGATYNTGFTGGKINSAGDMGTAVSNARFSLPKLLAASVVSVPGYDNNTTTKALRLETCSDGWTSNTPGGGRFDFVADAALPTTGIYVQEYKLYLPGDDSINKFSFGNVAKISGRFYDAKNASRSNDNTYVADVNDGWNKITAVTNLDGNYMIIYLNDQCVGYKARTRTGSETVSASNRIQINAYNIQTTTAGNDSKYWDGRYMYIDDFNMYSAPGKTQASSKLDGARNVSVTESPKIDFTYMLLPETTVGGKSTGSSYNVTIRSDGSPIEINPLSISADNKSIIIDPVTDLEIGTTYTVSVSGIKDMHDVVVDPYEFSFTTTEPSAIEITGTPSLTKVDPFSRVDAGTAITELDEGYIKASYTIRNKHASASNDAVMLVVLKDNGNVSAFQFEEVTLAAGESHTFSGAFDIKDANNQTVEFYVWDSMTSATDVATSYRYTASGISTIKVVE